MGMMGRCFGVGRAWRARRASCELPGWEEVGDNREAMCSLVLNCNHVAATNFILIV